jgi:hypothetical protein
LNACGGILLAKALVMKISVSCPQVSKRLFGWRRMLGKVRSLFGIAVIISV